MGSTLVLKYIIVTHSNVYKDRRFYLKAAKDKFNWKQYSYWIEPELDSIFTTYDDALAALIIANQEKQSWDNPNWAIFIHEI